MRNLIDLITEMSAGAISKLKTDIKTQVDKTSDEELLDRIYTVLNKTNLVDRISGTLERETDTTGYVADLTKLIIDTSGTYQEKHDFIKGFPHGYVDINLMLSGDRAKFDQLITGGPFVHRVFDALKQVTFGTAKGPGEFALAVMSPHIKITGKGDLNIGNKVVEVKANVGKSGGRLGTPGSLNFENVAHIIAKHTKTSEAQLKSNNLGLGGLITLSSNLTPAQRTSLGKELFDYIFGGEVDTGALVHALAASDEGTLKKEYTKANYRHYQKETGFSGLMLMNFVSQELKYYVDPESMAEEIYEPGVYIISKDKAFTARQILSQVTLRPFKEPPVVAPSIEQGTRTKEEIEKEVMKFATDLVRQRKANPAMVDPVAKRTLELLITGIRGKALMTRLVKDFPELSSRKPAAPAQPAQTVQEPEVEPVSEMARFGRQRRI